MSARGELFTTQITVGNRSYFFNVKENRAGDIFLQVVESKSRDGEDFERHQVAIFAEDLPRFLQGLDKSLSYIDQERVKRAAASRARQLSRPPLSAKSAPASSASKGAAKSALLADSEQDVGQAEAAERAASGVRRTGKVVHIKSKKSTQH